jgi:hypothetical protein
MGYLHISIGVAINIFWILYFAGLDGHPLFRWVARFVKLGVTICMCLAFTIWDSVMLTPTDLVVLKQADDHFTTHTEQIKRLLKGHVYSLKYLRAYARPVRHWDGAVSQTVDYATCEIGVFEANTHRALRVEYWTPCETFATISWVANPIFCIAWRNQGYLYSNWFIAFALSFAIWLLKKVLKEHGIAINLVLSQALTKA